MAVTPPESLWTVAGFTVARPIVDDRAVYIFGEHVVSAFDKLTGTSLWTTTLPDGPSDRLGYGTGIAGGLLIIGDIDVYGLDRASGAIRWTFAPRSNFPNERSFHRLATDGTTVYVGGVWGNVYAVDGSTGAERWVAHVTTLADSNIRVFDPVVQNDTVYVAYDDTPPGTLDDNGGAAAFVASSGRLVWSSLLPHHFNGPTETRSIVLTPTRAVTGTLDGFLYGLDRATGIVRDTISQTVFGFASGTSQATVFALATVGDSIVLAGTDDGNVTAFDMRNLKSASWQLSFGGSPQDLVVDGNTAYLDYGSTLIGALSIPTHKILWTFGPKLTPTAEEFLAAPAVDGERLYVGSDKHIYALRHP
ncbi:MAG TPA: PQQ-binding-like beta-propeller repeat protein [Gemmatimonadaceae bacterium]